MSVKEKHEAHKKLINPFGDWTAYFDFVLQRQEERRKQGIKYLDLSQNRPKLRGSIFLEGSSLQRGEWNIAVSEPVTEGVIRAPNQNAKVKTK